MGDGSSNIDCLVSIGSIFAIFKKPHEGPLAPGDALQSGRQIVAAGYALYGSATMIVLSTGHEGYEERWDPAVKEYVKSKKQGKAYGGRYIGSMVADVHRTLKYGGIFMYPATAEAPNGKLRVLYECMPMGYIMEQAGGLATDGEKPILDLVPKKLHERSPIFLGSKEDVEDVMAVIAKHK